MCIHISLPAIAFPALSQVPDLLAVFNKKNHRRAMFREDSSSHGLPLCPDIPNACYLQRGYENKKKELKMKVLREMKGEENLALPYIDTLHIIKTQHFLEQSEGRSGADLRSGRPRRTQMPACLGVLSTFHPLRVG